MKLFYGSEEADLSIILLSIITTENVALLQRRRDRGWKKKRADNKLFIRVFFLLELHLVIKPDKLSLLNFVIATGNPNAVSANKIISYLPVFPKSLWAVLEGIEFNQLIILSADTASGFHMSDQLSRSLLERYRPCLRTGRLLKDLAIRANNGGKTVLLQSVSTALLNIYRKECNNSLKFWKSDYVFYFSMWLTVLWVLKHEKLGWLWKRQKSGELLL